MKKHEVYETIIAVAKDIAKTKEGALFLITRPTRVRGLYKSLFPQVHKNFLINKKGANKVIEKLATLDGAVIISEDGYLRAYGVKLTKSKPVHGHGTKHAAASGMTSHIKDSTAVLISEEDHLIRVFQNGKCILEMDEKEKPKVLQDKIIAFISDGDTALLTAAGVSTAILGTAALGPLVIVGGTYLAIKTAGGVIKKSWDSIIKKRN
ncbi:DNA integrity scanning protein DisA nucleotide-binding domain protein [Candidatus Woesearchaeota archaeon]|nr:DNA integrity scanning protein DisA nucleotide-binding domain protein [Candidatus Woesearchaeota archaeon]